MKVIAMVATVSAVLLLVVCTVSLTRQTHPADLADVAHNAVSSPSAAASSPAAPNAASAGLPTQQEGLKILIGHLLESTQSQEAGKDATCWTTVRMMDAHFAGRPILDEVAALKIESCKTLMYHLWRRASQQVANGRVSIQSEDIDAALPEELRQSATLLSLAKPVFSSDPTRAVMNRDYQRVTENKRYLVSLAQEAVLGEGLFAGRRIDVLPLSMPAADRLAACATLVTTEFLTDCGQFAKAAGHDQIEDSDVRSAFTAIIRRWDIADQPVQAQAHPAYVDAQLLGLTREMIANKISSLRAWNGRIWKDGVVEPSERQRLLMNHFTPIPFDAKGFAELRARLEMYARYVALGIRPMQRNLFSSWINAHPHELDDPASLTDARKDFADLTWTLNVLEDLFPRQIAPSGDVTVTLMPTPSLSTSATRQELHLLDYELDAVRDTTLHWSIMADAWASPQARPADPFALEVLADRLSELALLFVRSCATLAQQQHVPVISAEICDQVLHGYQFAQPPRRDHSWPGDLTATKQGLFKTLPASPFIDASSHCGFPQSLQVVRLNVNQLGDKNPMDLVDFMGCGIAVGDVDGDGLPDVFLAGDGGNRLLRNLGNHRFADVTKEMGITDTRLEDAHQALFVDYNNEGRLDLFIVHSHSPSRLFHQNADGHFEDVTASCGIVTSEYAHDAVWFDYDNDGLLDCYVGTYGGSKPALDGRNGGKNRLFHNLGNGRFEDVTDKAGVGSTGWTLATAALDIDHDGWPDLFVANDYGRSELFHNNGDGTFTECAHRAGVDDRGSSMNASIVDVANDGWMGIYVTQIDMFSKSIGFVFPTDRDVINVNQRILGSTFYISGNKLYRNRHDGTFEATEEQAFEPGDRGWSWSANFFDYANAGHDDCYITNGWMDGTPAQQQEHQFFLYHDGRYYLWDRGGDQSYRSNARGGVAADLLGNGRIDLVVNDYGHPPRLLVNASHGETHWLKVHLRGVTCNRQGIGARVQVVHAHGSQWKQVSCGSNYLSQEDTVLTFGLGEDDHADRCEVVWPQGRSQQVSGPLASGKRYEVVENVSGNGSGSRTTR